MENGKSSFRRASLEALRFIVICLGALGALGGIGYAVWRGEWFIAAGIAALAGMAVPTAATWARRPGE